MCVKLRLLEIYSFTTHHISKPHITSILEAVQNCSNFGRLKIVGPDKNSKFHIWTGIVISSLQIGQHVSSFKSAATIGSILQILQNCSSDDKVASICWLFMNFFERTKFDFKWKVKLEILSFQFHMKLLFDFLWETEILNVVCIL